MNKISSYLIGDRVLPIEEESRKRTWLELDMCGGDAGSSQS